MTMKLHLGIVRRYRDGSTLTTTLCQRMNQASGDGMNIADTPEGVTCKFCLKSPRFAAEVAKQQEQAQ